MKILVTVFRLLEIPILKPKHLVFLWRSANYSEAKGGDSDMRKGGGSEGTGRAAVRRIQRSEVIDVLTCMWEDFEGELLLEASEANGDDMVGGGGFRDYTVS